HRWGSSIPGVVRRLPTSATPRIALTFDACGGPGGDGYDEALIELLKWERIAATLFVTARWLASHREAGMQLAQEPLFQIENHGSRHLPCTTEGRVAFGIPGPSDRREARKEIVEGRRAIASLGVKSPRYFRPGTGYFDPPCLALVRDLDAVPLGFTVSGDGAGTFDRARIARTLTRASRGAIVLMHMNHPEFDTAEGLADALPAMRARSLRFVTLSEAFAPDRPPGSKSERSGVEQPDLAPSTDTARMHR
ncbi:MAG: polysaccharide deacetylase family protein, partial [Myxococcota bacterium]